MRNVLTAHKLAMVASEAGERPEMADAIMRRYTWLRESGRTELDASLITLREIAEFDHEFTGHFVDALYEI